MLEHVLLAVDDSPASKRVVQYVGRTICTCAHGYPDKEDVHVTILHVFPRNLESQYATGQALAHEIRRPKYEFELERDHDVAVHAHQIRRPTDDAREDLIEFGVPRDAIEVHHLQAGPAMDVAGMILQMARRLSCDTIAVGRNRDLRLLRTHVSDVLIRKSEDIAIWVVH